MTGNRVAWTGAWSREHNNPRYAELMPRLTNVDRFYIDMHPWWPLRGIRRRLQLPLLSFVLGRLYPLMLCTDWRQIRLFHAPCVVDHDDPVYAREELAALSRPNVALIVVTTDGVRERLRAAGIKKRIEIIPQGIVPPVVENARIVKIRSQWMDSEKEIVVGLHQPHFEFADELGGPSIQQMYAVNDLFSVMECAHGLAPHLSLWLVGKPSLRVVEYARTHPWVKLLGYHDRSELMDYVSAFDIGIYPRRGDVGGRASVKVLEYMACGIPVVGFDVEEMRIASDQGAGVTANLDSFHEQIVALASEPDQRKIFGNQGKKISSQYAWDVLAGEYKTLLESGLAEKSAMRKMDTDA
jgi:glycosyltransferase involved in cell wall biosynthesis